MREVHYLLSFSRSKYVSRIFLDSWINYIVELIFSQSSLRLIECRSFLKIRVSVEREKEGKRFLCAYEKRREKHRKARAYRVFLIGSTVLRSPHSVGFQFGTRRQLERALYTWKKEGGPPLITRDKCRIVLESVEREPVLSTDTPILVRREVRVRLERNEELFRQSGGWSQKRHERLADGGTDGRESRW